MGTTSPIPNEIRKAKDAAAGAQAAADAADTTATNAQSLAQTARDAAEAAASVASAAQTQAAAATVLAGGMLIVSYSPASGVGVADGAMWRQIDLGGRLVGMWSWEAAVGAWSANPISPTIIASAIIGDLAAGSIDTSQVTIRSPGATTYGIFDGDGIRAYASAVQTVNIDFTTGDVMFMGTYRNAPVGSNRIEVKPYGSGGWGASIGFLSSANATGHSLIFGAGQAQLRPMTAMTVDGSTTIAGNYALSKLGVLSLYGNIGGEGQVYISGSSGAVAGVVDIGNADDVQINGDSVMPSGVTDYDTGWVSLVAASGFTGSGGPAVRRVGRTLHFRGGMTGTIAAATTVAVATIPTGYRPPGSQSIPIVSSSGFSGYASVNGSTGVISVHFKSPYTGGSLTPDFSGLSGLLAD